ncbi:MAG: protease complex subunit PrcB family protein [Lachnospiraceae bacterium]
MNNNKIKAKKMVIVILTFLELFTTIGCGLEKSDVEKVRDLKFTVIEADEIPQELAAIMEEKRESGFKLTYEDKKNLYLAIGYGVQDTGGYSISAEECFLGKNAVYVKTTLQGPKKGEQVNQVKSYPHIVIKTEYLEKNVVFQ